MRHVTVIEFIEQSFIPDMEKALSVGLQYYVFPLICQAIELIGALSDDKPFNALNESENRFTRGLRTLFKDDDRYRNNQSKFFKHLRGCMIHQLRPGTDILLSSEKYDKVPRSRHLARVDNDKRILVIEQFFDDFKSAFDVLKKMLNKSGIGIDQGKLTEKFFGYGPITSIYESMSSLSEGSNVYSTNIPSASGSGTENVSITN